MKRIYLLTLSFFLGLLAVSCNEESTPATKTDSVKNNSPAAANAPVKIDVKTFPVTDSASGAVLGYGYDLYFDGKRTIHQPIIPGASGVTHFKTQEDAEKTGRFLADKISKTGTWTIFDRELDSLGIKR